MLFTPGTIWGIDSFDRGASNGKQLAQHIIPELESKEESALAHDGSTNNLIKHYRQLKEAL
jgi:glucose-6-phosphate isomerase